MKKLFVILAIVLALGVMSTSLVAAKGFKPGDQTIAEIAIENGNFDTLVAALSCTGLVPAVSDASAEFTVFAPTDAAFAGLSLNKGNICTVFDTDTLTDILLYHVVDERRPSPSVIRGNSKSIMMLSGDSIMTEGKGGLSLYDVNSTTDVDIIIPDILASNGIIHVIDDVLLPFEF